MNLNISQSVACTEAEGPGNRFALWMQGCPMDCPGCCNPEMIPFVGGKQASSKSLLEEILNAQTSHSIEGVTIMGGEPFAQAEALADLTVSLQQHDLSVMIFSGYTFSELLERSCEDINRVLANTDILVDGRYDAKLPDKTRRWIGSQNQQIHFFTDRYSERDAYWAEPDTLELRWKTAS